MAGEETAVAMGAVFVVLFILFILAMVALGVLAMIFWIFMLVDCAKRRFKEDSEKVVWILVIALTGAIGAIIYYFVVKKKARK